MNIRNMPSELFLEIVSYLGEDSIRILSCVNKDLNATVVGLLFERNTPTAIEYQRRYIKLSALRQDAQFNSDFILKWMSNPKLTVEDRIYAVSLLASAKNYHLNIGDEKFRVLLNRLNDKNIAYKNSALNTLALLSQNVNEDHASELANVALDNLSNDDNRNEKDTVIFSKLILLSVINKLDDKNSNIVIKRLCKIAAMNDSELRECAFELFNELIPSLAQDECANIFVCLLNHFSKGHQSQVTQRCLNLLFTRLPNVLINFLKCDALIKLFSDKNRIDAPSRAYLRLLSKLFTTDDIATIAEKLEYFLIHSTYDGSLNIVSDLLSMLDKSQINRVFTQILQHVTRYKLSSLDENQLLGKLKQLVPFLDSDQNSKLIQLVLSYKTSSDKRVQQAVWTILPSVIDYLSPIDIDMLLNCVPQLLTESESQVRVSAWKAYQVLLKKLNTDQIDALLKSLLDKTNEASMLEHMTAIEGYSYISNSSSSYNGQFFDHVIDNLSQASNANCDFQTELLKCIARKASMLNQQQALTALSKILDHFNSYRRFIPCRDHYLDALSAVASLVCASHSLNYFSLFFGQLKYPNNCNTVEMEFFSKMLAVLNQEQANIVAEQAISTCMLDTLRKLRVYVKIGDRLPQHLVPIVFEQITKLLAHGVGDETNFYNAQVIIKALEWCTMLATRLSSENINTVLTLLAQKACRYQVQQEIVNFISHLIVLDLYHPDRLNPNIEQLTQDNVIPYFYDWYKKLTTLEQSPSPFAANGFFSTPGLPENIASSASDDASLEATRQM